MKATQFPIDVIAMCSANGDIRPLRLRIEDENHQLLRVDIAEVLNCREICYAGIEAKVFLCRAQVEERNWLFELKYTIRSHRWQFMRMVYG